MNTSAKPANETWQEIQCAVESLSDLAKQEVSPTQFYSELVRNLTDLTSAEYCQVWARETLPAATQQVDSESSDSRRASWAPVKGIFKDSHSGRSRSSGATQNALADLIDEASKASSETFVDAGQLVPGTDGVSLNSDLLLQRVHVGDEVIAVIEFGHEPGRPPSQREGTKHLATVASEIASEFERNWQLRQLADRENRRENLDRFVDRVHQSYDLRRVGYAIANEGKELIECDRVSLVVRRGRRCRVLAVSGVQKPDRRSPTVQSIQRLAKAKIRESEPLWLTPDDAGQSRSPVNRYFAESNARHVGLLPLTSPADGKRKPERIGTLLVEVFDENETVKSGLMASRANWLVRHSSNALSNAIHVNRLPMLSLSRWLDRNVTRGRRIPWLAIFTALLLAGLWYAAWLPTDFRIDARGELVPVNRELVFAPRAGTVIEFPLLADRGVPDDSNNAERTDGQTQNNTQGTRVDAGDVLVQMENADLDYELTTLLGEQSTIDKQLDTIAKSIGQFGGARDAESRRRYDELTTQAAELKVKQASISRRIRLVKRERERLAVRASIDGQILTWDVVKDLKLRPVQQGDLLLEIVDLDGPWELDLYVRDRHIGYVKNAENDADAALKISFFHRSNPEEKYSGEVKSMSMSTEVYPEYGSAVRLVGKIDQLEELREFRPGTTIVAKIDCGKKPLAYVIAYDLIHTIRMWTLF